MPSATSASRGSVPSRRRTVDSRAVLLLPALVVVGVFFAYPVVEVLARSFQDFTPPEQSGADNYRWFFETDVNVTVLGRTFTTAALVTAVCLVVAYPYAYLLTVVRPSVRALLFGAVLIPFWTSLMVRNYAWVVLMQPGGPLDDLLGLNVLGTATAVTIGMAQVLLPFMVLPLYANLRTIDPALMRAAGSLGARPSVAWAKIYLPLSLPGVLAGSLLCFVLALGFYITPGLLGSPQNSLLSQLIVVQVSQVLAFGKGGAMAAVLLAATLILLAAVAVATARILRRTSTTRLT